MKYDPAARAIVLTPEDLADPVTRAGWEAALEDGVAVTSRRGAPTQEIPIAEASAYLPDFLIDLARREALEQTKGDDYHTWTGWEPILGDDRDEW